MSFAGCRLVSFKLREQINIDEMWEKESFTFERPYLEGDELMKVIEETLIGFAVMTVIYNSYFFFRF